MDSNSRRALSSLTRDRLGRIRAGWRVLLFLCLAFGLLLAAQRAVLLVFPSLGPRLRGVAAGNTTPESLVLSQALLFIAVFLALRIMARVERKRLADFGLPAPRAHRSAYWSGVGWGLSAGFVLFLLLWLEGAFAIDGLAVRGWDIPGNMFLYALGVTLVGFVEEVAFRGYLQHTLAEALGFWRAALLISVAFGGLHLLSPGYSIAGVVSAASFGLFFCLTLRRTGTLWFAIGMHSAFDFVETFVFSPVTGHMDFAGHLFDCTLRGPAWLTGGSVGPESGVNGIAGLAILFVGFGRRGPRNYE